MPWRQGIAFLEKRLRVRRDAVPLFKCARALGLTGRLREALKTARELESSTADLTHPPAMSAEIEGKLASLA